MTDRLLFRFWYELMDPHSIYWSQLLYFKSTIIIIQITEHQAFPNFLVWWGNTDDTTEILKVTCVSDYER